MESPDTIAIVISIIAIIASAYTFFRSNQTSKTSCKPYLNILYEFSDDDTSLILKNVGMGSAIITSVLFEKNRSKNTNIVSLLSINESKFSEHRDFLQDEYGLYPKETLVLCKLRKSDFKIKDYDTAVKQLKEDLKDISVTIEFKDIFDKKQNDKEIDFSYIVHLKR